MTSAQDENHQIAISAITSKRQDREDEDDDDDDEDNDRDIKLIIYCLTK